jgi:hypothetical protein
MILYGDRADYVAKGAYVVRPGQSVTLPAAPLGNVAVAMLPLDDGNPTGSVASASRFQAHRFRRRGRPARWERLCDWRPPLVLSCRI